MWNWFKDQYVPKYAVLVLKMANFKVFAWIKLSCLSRNINIFQFNHILYLHHEAPFESLTIIAFLTFNNPPYKSAVHSSTLFILIENISIAPSHVVAQYFYLNFKIRSVDVSSNFNIQKFIENKVKSMKMISSFCFKYHCKYQILNFWKPQESIILWKQSIINLPDESTGEGIFG